jgi:hypothetical protein
MFDLDDQSGGAVTIQDESRIDYGQIQNSVWTDTLTTYTDGMAGKRLKGITAVPTLEGAVNDASSTATSFATTLTGYGDTFFDDALLIVEISVDEWQGRPVDTYTSTTGVFTVDEPFISAPADASNIAVKATHIHPIAQIQSGLATEAKQDIIDANVDAILALLDDPRAEPGQGAPPVNADMATKLDYIYKAWRNKTEQTATTYSLYDDAGTTVDQKATVSDDGTTFTKNEQVSGP